MTNAADKERRIGVEKAWIFAAAILFLIDLIFLGDALLPGRFRAPADIVSATKPASGADPAAPKTN